MANKVLCNKCESTKTRSDFWIKDKTKNGLCNRCFKNIDKND